MQTNLIRGIIFWIVRQRLRSDRGMYWLPMMDFLSGTYGVITSGLMTGIFYYGLVRLIGWVLGYVDEKIIKSWQYQNQYQTEILNPYFKELKRSVRRK